MSVFEGPSLDLGQYRYCGTSVGYYRYRGPSLALVSHRTGSQLGVHVRRRRGREFRQFSRVWLNTRDPCKLAHQ